jgi:hypothetical protein
VPPIAAPVVLVGRMFEHRGSFRLKNGHGSGMIKLVVKSSPSKGDALRFGNTNPLVGSVRGHGVACLVGPGLKVHGLGGTDADQDS